MTYAQITPPGAEALTLVEIKAHLRIDHDHEDGLLDALAAAARLHLEAVTGLVLIRRDLRLYLDDWPSSGMVEIARGPVVAVSEIRIYDEAGVETVLDLDGLVLDGTARPARMWLRNAQGPGRALNGIEIDFTAGFGEAGADLPDTLKRAMLVHVARMYEFRGAVAADMQPASIPEGYDRLIAPYLPEEAVMQLTFFDAGQLTARVDVEAASATPDGQGGATLDHAVVATLWARIEPVGADIAELGHVERQTVTHRIWTRLSDAVRPGRRFRKGPRLFRILSVHDPDETGRYLVARVTEEKPMTGRVNALQKAIHALLSGDSALTALIGADGVFDRRLTGRPMPYLAIATIETRDIGPGVEEHAMTLEAWSDAEGRRQVQTIAGLVRALLDGADPVLEDGILVSLQHRSTQVRREARTKAFLAEIVFRAVTD